MKYHTTKKTIRTALLPLLGAGAGMALIALAGTGCGQNSGASQSTAASDPPTEQSQGQTAQSVSASDPAPNQSAPAPAPQAAQPAPSAEHGQQLFTGTCTGCHGAQGQGVPHLGKDLQTSPFVSGLNDDKLTDFITQGRAVTDPANTTHVPMPPKGGNPALSAQDISDIVAYIRQLQHEHTAAK